ncbi:MAG: hypothetical protein GXO35_09475 [Gammaproteobacteria bacterium]|nr:hypothetical protein [Gammaproteobacteria bacterium]
MKYAVTEQENKMRFTAELTSVARLAMHLVIALCALQDLACRLVFLANNYNWLADGCWYASYPVLFVRMPGSYLNRQLAVLTYFLYAGAVLLSHLDLVAARRVAAETTAFFSGAWHLSDASDGEAMGRNLRAHVDRLLFLFERQQLLADVLSKVIFFGLLLRFLQAIYALRLVPGIGFFVITAKKMADHLAQFAVVFIIVLLAFGTIFYFIMRQTQCPAKKVSGFQSLSSSLFSAYQVSLSSGISHFSLGLNAKLAYVAFTVIATVLLLNLIIAVMTTTVEYMNQAPWKAMLNDFELWDEILGVEAGVLVLTSCFKCFQKYYKSSRMTTFESVLCQNGKYFT